MNKLMLKDSPTTLEKTAPSKNETVEINLSSDKSAAEVSANIDDPDSALGDGISDSQPISGATTSGGVGGLAYQPPRPVLNPDSTFQPVQMNMSETGSSSNGMSSQVFEDSAVNSPPPPEQQQDERVTETEVKKLIIPEINPDASAKLAVFLDKVKRDERFQFSLPSTSHSVPKEDEPDNNETKITFGTDIHSDSTVNESKFLKGLETSKFELEEEEEDDD